MRGGEAERRRGGEAERRRGRGRSAALISAPSRASDAARGSHRQHRELESHGSGAHSRRRQSCARPKL
eukprot:scaffold31_cov263-Pinguiococcus_pyrenoidosus.AAC.21